MEERRVTCDRDLRLLLAKVSLSSGLAGEVRPVPLATRYAPPQRNDGTQPPPSHFLTHLPADPRCSTCAESKGRKVVAPRKPEAKGEEEDEQLRALDRVMWSRMSEM